MEAGEKKERPTVIPNSGSIQFNFKNNESASDVRNELLGFRFEPLYCKEEKENQIEHLLGKSSALQNNYNFLKKQKH